MDAKQAREAVGLRSKSLTACWVHFDVQDDGQVRIDTSWLPLEEGARLGPDFHRTDGGQWEAVVPAIKLDGCLERVLSVFRRRMF